MIGFIWASNLCPRDRSETAKHEGGTPNYPFGQFVMFGRQQVSWVTDDEMRMSILCAAHADDSASISVQLQCKYVDRQLELPFAIAAVREGRDGWHLIRRPSGQSGRARCYISPSRQYQLFANVPSQRLAYPTHSYTTVISKQ
jgi:hypothetical protein